MLLGRPTQHEPCSSPDTRASRYRPRNKLSLTCNLMSKLSSHQKRHCRQFARVEAVDSPRVCCRKKARAGMKLGFVGTLRPGEASRVYLQSRHDRNGPKRPFFNTIARLHFGQACDTRGRARGTRARLTGSGATPSRAAKHTSQPVHLTSRSSPKCCKSMRRRHTALCSENLAAIEA